MKKRCLLILVASLTLRFANVSGQTPSANGDEWLSHPVDDRTFNAYLDFFAYDRALPLDLRVSKTDEEQGMRSERLSFQSTLGVRVPAILWQAVTQSKEKKRAVILLHGGGANGKEGVKGLATLLVRAGWAVFAIDMLYFGERSTDLLTTFSEQDKHDRLYNQPPLYLAWVTQTAKDVSRSFDLLVDKRGFDADRIVLAGGSRGAIVASIVGAVERRVAAVVLMFGGHFDALESNHLPAACPANYIGRIAPRPLLMINAMRDSDIIKDRAVDPLFKLAKEPKQIIWSDGGHGSMSEANRADLIQWLRDKVK